LSWTCATSRCSTSTAPTELSSARCGRGCAPTPPPTSRWPVRSTAAAPSPTRHDNQARLRPFYMIHTCYPTGAGDDHGIDPNKKWLRLPYVSTFFCDHIVSTRTRTRVAAQRAPTAGWLSPTPLARLRMALSVVVSVGRSPSAQLLAVGLAEAELQHSPQGVRHLGPAQHVLDHPAPQPAVERPARLHRGEAHRRVGAAQRLLHRLQHRPGPCAAAAAAALSARVQMRDQVGQDLCVSTHRTHVVSSDRAEVACTLLSL
jgi:hypothetical protein